MSDDKFDPPWITMLNDPNYGIIVMRSYPGVIEVAEDRDRSESDAEFLRSIGISSA